MKPLATVLLFTLALLSTSAQSQKIEEYLFYDTLRMSYDGFISSSTVFSDISDNGHVAGYYRNENNENEGLVLLNNGFIIFYQHPGYTHTEITGVNASNQIVGRAYNSPSTAVVIRGDIDVDNFEVVNVTESSFNGLTGPNKTPLKLNNNGIAIGHVRSGSHRWLAYEDVFGAGTTKDLVRYQKGATILNTYGQGGNDDINCVGYLLDGAERIPFYYDKALDRITQMNHRNDTPSLKGTILNDINDEGMVVLEFKNGSNIYQAGWGMKNGNTIDYAANIPLLQSKFGSSLTGVNNNGDIVGWIRVSATETVAFMAKKGAQRIKGFDAALHGVDFGNDSAVFSYPAGKYDYETKDPFTGKNDSIISHLLDYAGELDIDVYLGLVEGTMSPSWRSYVIANSEDSCYINGQARLSSLHKWSMVSDGEFGGWCYGITAFMNQHFSNPEVLYERFPSIPKEDQADAYKDGTMPFDVDEAIGAMQFYQFSQHMSYEAGLYSNNVRLMYAALQGDQEAEAIQQRSIRNSVSVIGKAMSAEKGQQAYHGMGIYLVFPNGSEGGHAVFPVKVSKPLEQNQGYDTVTVVDPNYPNTYIHIVCDYDNNTYRALNDFGNEEFRVFALATDGPLVNLNIGENADTDRKSKVKKPGELNKFEGRVNQIMVGSLCDYTVTNVGNASEKITYSNGSYSQDYENAYVEFVRNSDKNPDILTFEKELNEKVEITGCDNGYRMAYQFDKGMVIMSRKESSSTDVDVIYLKPNELTIENTGSQSKSFTLSAIFSGDDKETAVSIGEYSLEQNQKVRLKILDGNSFRVYNDEQDNISYNLNARYLSDEFYSWETGNIRITPTTNHTVVFRPKDPGDQRVKILVDTLQDGTNDDTLNIENGTNSINAYALLANVHIFPNPASSSFQIDLENTTGGMATLQLVSSTGQMVKHLELGNTRFTQRKVMTQSLPPGVYYVHVHLNGQRAHSQKMIILR
jgi:hypothetical protein